MDAPPKKQRSPVFYVFLGCGIVILLMMIGGGVVCGGCYMAAKNMQDDLVDPKKQAANAEKALGQLPKGYHPVVTLSMPFGMMDMVVLGDRPPLADGGADHDFDRGFMFFRVMANENAKRAQTFFDEEDGDTSGLRASGINVDAKDILKRGTAKTATGTAVKWVATRGTLTTNNGGTAREGLNTLLWFTCPQDQAMRVGVWMSGDPDPSKPAADLDLTGTVADEEQVISFTKQLAPCGK
jgi:hypothetical protein